MPGLKPIRALIAVSDASARRTLTSYFRARGDEPEVTRAAGAMEALAALCGRREPGVECPSLLVVEIRGSEKELTEIRREFPGMPLIAVAPASADLAFRLAKIGAVEMLGLPLNEADVRNRLDDALSAIAATAASEQGYLPEGGDPELPELPRLFSSSPRMAEIRETIDKVATTSATVLIRGESGVGKDIVARAIFARSERNLKPFVKVNCAAIPNELLESELFGFEAGAFTGAQRAKPGKFELANHGTLFLDEIAEMHPGLQAKLLHVLQDGEFARLGAKRDTAVDVRVLCATNKILEQRVAEGLFREDLFYRVNVVTVHIPPLRERRDEIPVLLRFFIEKYSGVYRRAVKPFSEETMQLLLAYSWPGNIRELENLCKRYVIVGNSTQIVREIASRTPVPVEREMAAGRGDGKGATMLPELSLLEIGRRAAWAAEREAIRSALEATRWNRKEAAKRLHVSYKALLNKLHTMETEDGPQSGT